jgi:hypothetical protein
MIKGELRRVMIIISCCIGGLLLFASFSFVQEFYKLEEVPKYKQGTFWKYSVKYTDHTGQMVIPSKPVYNYSYYIDGQAIHKSDTMYRITIISHEGYDSYKSFIGVDNLKISDAIVTERSVKNRANSTDTLSRQIELFKFPLYLGKKWESTVLYQEFLEDSIVGVRASFEVKFIKDTMFYISNRKIETKAYFFEAKILENNPKGRVGKYMYLAPSEDFPGSCPLIVWDELNEDGPQKRYDLVDYYWRKE